MKKITLVFILSVLFGSGCAYFNTFYNAKQYYKKAYDETKKNLRGKPTSTENNYYQESIDRSLTLIVRYPNSKYVDDALLLAGKAYYYRQEYFKAKRKFLELLTNYPESPFKAEAQLWMARTHFALDEFEEAEALINQLISSNVPKWIQGQANYYRGKFYERKRNFSEAVKAFRKAIEYGIQDQLANAFLSLGTSLDTLGHYDEAKKAFDKVSKNTRMTDMDFKGRFYSAQMNKKLGHKKQALSDFQTLLADEDNTKHIPDIKLQIADTYYRGDEPGTAIDYYDEITQLHERSIQAAEAFFRMGLIYEKYYRDYEKALDNFLKVKETSSRSVYADTAEIYARDIQRLQALRHMADLGKRGETGEALLIENEGLEEDTLTLDLAYDMMDTTKGDTACYRLLRKFGGKVFADSVFEEKNKTMDERQREYDLNLGIDKDLLVDWRKWVEEGEIPSYSNFEIEFSRLQKLLKKREESKIADNPELSTFRVEELDRNLFLLAELYMFRFESPDSAFNQYDYLVRKFPQSLYTPRALYNMAHLYKSHYQNPQQLEFIYQTLADEYGDTVYGHAARKSLGYKNKITSEDSVRTLFTNAESMLFENKSPRKAISIYDQIWNQYPNTMYEPKVMYAIGYVYENYLDSLDQAYVIYDSLLTKYPDSPYARRVQHKVTAVDNRQFSVDDAEPSSHLLATESMDSTMSSPDTTKLALSSAETTGEELSAAEPSDHPQTALSRRGRSTKSRIKIRLDVMAKRRRQNRWMQMDSQTQ
ncbi:tetratricopeptide repeat protein [bacterium]|nr:tetratricopeptide repeat protein [bacterium]